MPRPDPETAGRDLGATPLAADTAETPELRILVLARCAPRWEGAHGGARAVAGLVSGLAERNRVALVYLRAADEPAVSEDVATACEQVVEVPRDEPRAGFGRIVQKARNMIGLLAGRPVWVSKWSARALPAALRRTIRDWQPDVLQVEFEVMARFLDAVRDLRIPTVLTVHDPGLARARESVNGHGLVARRDARAWGRFERGVFATVDAVVAFTPRDAAALRAHAGATPVRCIPLGHPVPATAASPTGAPEPSALFVGNLMHPPNRDAANWLVERIFPEVVRRVPAARLMLLGEGTGALDGARPLVVGAGRVPDIWPYLDAANVVVAPIRTGGGMRVKVLEALAAGKAVVATPRAVEGLDVAHGRELLIAETATDFADAIARLLLDPELRAGLARAARDWAEANLGWARTVAGYGELYRELLGTRRTPRRRS